MVNRHYSTCSKWEITFYWIGIAFQWTNTTVPCWARRKSFSMSVTQEVVNLYYHALHLTHCWITVPVVVVLTKCDALLAPAFGKLKQDERKLPLEEQFMRIKEYAKEMLRDNTVWERLKMQQYPPKDCVHLESKCDLVCWNMIHSLSYRYTPIRKWMSYSLGTDCKGLGWRSHAEVTNYHSVFQSVTLHPVLCAKVSMIK